MLVQDNTIVAAVQYQPTLLNPIENISIATQLTFEAAAKTAKLIVLPELCLSGISIRSLREAADVAQTKNGYQTEAFTAIARKFGCHIVFGYVELCDGNFYNSAALVGPFGLEANFQKHNLWGPDNLWAIPSEQQVFTTITAAGRTGVLICRDIINRYRESYKFSKPEQKFYKKGDVDTICLLTSWGESYGYPDSSWIELSEATGANVIVSNRVGKERDLEFKGGSVIIDKNKKIWTNGSSFTEPAVVGGLITL